MVSSIVSEPDGSSLVPRPGRGAGTGNETI